MDDGFGGRVLLSMKFGGGPLCDGIGSGKGIFYFLSFSALWDAKGSRLCQRSSLRHG